MTAQNIAFFSIAFTIITIVYNQMFVKALNRVETPLAYYGLQAVNVVIGCLCIAVMLTAFGWKDSLIITVVGVAMNCLVYWTVLRGQFKNMIAAQLAAQIKIVS